MGFTNYAPAWEAFTTGSCLFPGAVAGVVSHGLAKERVVPTKEIDRAVERKKQFEADPAKHTYEEI